MKNSIPDLIRAAGGKITFQIGRGYPTAIEQAKQQAERLQLPGNSSLQTDTSPLRPICMYLGEKVEDIKVACTEPRVPMHKCLCIRRPEVISRYSKKPLQLMALPSTNCNKLQGKVTFVCNSCEFWTEKI